MEMSSPQFGVSAPRVYGYTDRDTPRRSTAAALADLFDAVPKAAFIRGDGKPSGIDEGADPHGADGEAGIEENLRDEYYMPRTDPQTSVKKRGEEVWICSEHGPTCTPGICEACERVESEGRW
jgi:hypothetical protein